MQKWREVRDLMAKKSWFAYHHYIFSNLDAENPYAEQALLLLCCSAIYAVVNSSEEGLAMQEFLHKAEDDAVERLLKDPKKEYTMQETCLALIDAVIAKVSN